MKPEAINAVVREKTGKSIAHFARNNNTSRENVYRSFRGEGTREMRIKIALIIGTLPSLIWEHNDEETKLIDNFQYIRQCNIEPLKKNKKVKNSVKEYAL